MYMQWQHRQSEANDKESDQHHGHDGKQRGNGRVRAIIQATLVALTFFRGRL